MTDRCQYINLTVILAQLRLECVLSLLLHPPRLDFSCLDSRVNVVSGSRSIWSSISSLCSWHEHSQINNLASNLMASVLFDGHEDPAKCAGAQKSVSQDVVFPKFLLSLACTVKKLASPRLTAISVSCTWSNFSGFWTEGTAEKTKYVRPLSRRMSLSLSRKPPFPFPMNDPFQ
jgi:hypothetical protein